MWNLFKGKPKDKEAEGTIRLAVNPLSEEAGIIRLVRAYYCLDEREATIRIFEAGLAEMKKRMRESAIEAAVGTLPYFIKETDAPTCAEVKTETLETKEAKETEEAEETAEKAPTPTPAPAKRGGYRGTKPVTTGAIPKGSLRFSCAYFGSQRRQSIRFSKKDGEKIEKAGYRWYDCEYYPSSVRVSLYRDSQKTGRVLKKASLGKYTLLTFPDELINKRMAEVLGVTFSKDKVTDIPYSMTEGKGCLVLNIKRPINY